jgi:hypothetical protein
MVVEDGSSLEVPVVPEKSWTATEQSFHDRRREKRAVVLNCSMDIATTDDVALLVDRFYGKVRCGALLGPIFNDVAQVDWPSHMATLYSFWETMLLGTGTYRGAPFCCSRSLRAGRPARATGAAS